MEGITICTNGDCKVRRLCYRYMIKPTGIYKTERFKAKQYNKCLNRLDIPAGAEILSQAEFREKEDETTNGFKYRFV